MILKMNCYGLQQNAFAACEEMRGSVNFVDQKEPVICPKPRRVGVVSSNLLESIASLLSFVDINLFLKPLNV